MRILKRLKLRLWEWRLRSQHKSLAKRVGFLASVHQSSFAPNHKAMIEHALRFGYKLQATSRNDWTEYIEAERSFNELYQAALSVLAAELQYHKIKGEGVHETDYDTYDA